MEQIPYYRLKRVEHFYINDYHYIGSFVFDNLKKLQLGNYKNGNSAWLNSTKRMKVLKKLKLWRASLLIENYQILLTELIELELIIVLASTQNECNVLIQSLGREWKQIQMEKNDHSDDIYRVTFQRQR